MGLMGIIFELAVLGCIAVGIACSAAVVGTCEMLTLGGNRGNVGPWRANISSVTDGCVSWDKDETDAADWILNMGRACSMMALIFGCILGFFGFFNQCLCPLPLGQKLIDISGGMVQLSLVLVWPMIRSSVCDKYGCSWGNGVSALILAQFAFIFASVFSRCMREPRYKRIQKRNDEEGNDLQSSLLEGSDV